ncbi:MAG TPA: hypothetical protein VFK09_04195 [Gemmatimonadales bacterium]|nr:hypothetical protein [Gemmatimonadales bacterium]
MLTAAATSGVAMADEEELELERPVLMTAEAAPEPFMPELEGPHPVAHRPRIRIALSGTGARRPFRWALGGVVLAATTHIGLQAAPNLHLAGELPLPHVAATLESSRQARDGTGPAEPAPRAPEPQGSPSFGSSSAFATTTAGTSSPHHAPAAPLAMANPTSTGAPAPAPADSAPVIAPKPAIAIAGAVPPIGPTADNRTPAGLVSRYQSAYADARTELETGLRTAGFANLFDPERLGTVEGVKEARRSVGTATAYVAKYRRREAEIEAAYGDSAAALAKEYGWTEQQQKAWSRRKVLQESPQVAKLASFLLQSLDSLYGVLSAQEGAYELRLGTLTFRDPKAAQAYAELRPWLDPKVHAWADSSASAAGPSSAVRVLRAMGPAKLPESGGF